VILNGMIVNERLLAKSLLEEYYKVKVVNDLTLINTVLAQASLRQNENGMNWVIGKNAKN